jgi:dienelactone hydrolase
MRRAASLALLLLLAPSARADGPDDNKPENVRRVPKPGIEVAPADRQSLEEGLGELKGKLDRLRDSQDPKVAALVPDVEIFDKAVRDALEFREFFAPADVDKAKGLLREGLSRADQLLGGSAPWAQARGLVVRGYRSKIDGSVQPYGLVIPGSYTFEGKDRYRLDVWFHGRGETLSEVNFLHERMRQPGQFTPADTIVLHPYGRYCNAFKFAGEVDVYEALDSARAQYRVDDDLIAVRGFSMGGAACWQFAVHDASRWFAANPGAGFSETPRFLDVFQKEALDPTWYERKLWQLYDCDDWAANLKQCPTVAYSGELDSQKQAADVMAEALLGEGIELTHVIGPGTKHAYHPDSAREVERRLDAIAAVSAVERKRAPTTIDFVTYTLRYNRMGWVTVDGLDEHWEPARVWASRGLDTDDDGVAYQYVDLSTENVNAMSLDFPPGRHAVGDEFGPVVIDVDGQELEGPLVQSDRSWSAHLVRDAQGDWSLGTPEDSLRKRHGLQGPIDDAFMDAFVFVRPTGTPRHEKVGAWAESEMNRAVEHWRRHFRGRARVVDDTAVTDELIASANLVLWGDPESNAVLKRVADKLPIRWDAEAVRVGDATFPAEHHAPILIYPNPLNPDRYVVLNSSFTFRDYDYLNNARQVPKLPDWAVIDVRTPPDSRWPGKVVEADFFGEDWELRGTKRAQPRIREARRGRNSLPGKESDPDRLLSRR